MELNIPEVVWENLADDDFVFRFEDYLLRVEQMDDNSWWWSVSYKNLEFVEHINPSIVTTELEAKMLAKTCFRCHYIEQL